LQVVFFSAKAVCRVECAVFPMGSWFKRVFGFEEADYEITRKAFSYDSETGELVAHVKKEDTTRSFKAGTFDCPSLEQFRSSTNLFEVSKSFGAGRLRVAEVVGDVSAFHTERENRFAVFQAASQFNTLEHTSQRGTPELGITCYSGDRTQGPACATACAPGTVVRNYFGLDGKGQSVKRQVRNLAEVEELLENEKERFFEVVNGYTLSKDTDLKRLTDKLRKDEVLREEIKKSLRIGVQSDTEVTCSSFGMRPYEGDPGQQLVTQAYCSAVSVSYSRCSGNNWELFARLVLDSLYEATLYAAVRNLARHEDEPGARRVFLTAVGGGVFGNDMRWVYDAMRQAFKKFERVGLEIYLVSYGGSTPEFRQLAEEFPGSDEAADT